MMRGTDRLPDYSHWQVLLLRDALEAYRRFNADHETGKRPMSWNALREKVWTYTDVDFGKDDLRQFVEGKKLGQGNFRVPQPHRLHAVYRFLTDEHIAMLTPDEFDNAEFIGVQAPLHLSRYLVSLAEPLPIEFPRSLVGQFESIGYTDDRLFQKHLQILFEGPGFASVSETHEVYNFGVPPVRRDSKHMRRMISGRMKPDARIRHSGWAIMTPEDNMLIFMKNIDTRENHYWKFAVEHPVWEERLVNDLLLNRFDWPLFLDGEATTGKAVSLSATQAASDTWHFTRRGAVDNGE